MFTLNNNVLFQRITRDDFYSFWKLLTTRSIERPKFFIFEQENTCFTDISKMLNINKNIIFLILVFPIYLFSQNISESEIKSFAYQIIKESEYSVFVTLDSNNNIFFRELSEMIFTVFKNCWQLIIQRGINSLFLNKKTLVLLIYQRC